VAKGDGKAPGWTWLTAVATTTFVAVTAAADPLIGIDGAAVGEHANSPTSPATTANRTPVPLYQASPAPPARCAVNVLTKSLSWATVNAYGASTVAIDSSFARRTATTATAGGADQLVFEVADATTFCCANLSPIERL